jgi:hypothetical protein
LKCGVLVRPQGSRFDVAGLSVRVQMCMLGRVRVEVKVRFKVM